MVEEVKPTNFIRQIIDRDLEEHKFTSIRTRFPPEPNGYLHVGHAKSICLNFGLARDYNGKCNLRFDDTNPSKEDTEYVDSIKQDVEWLGFKWDGEPKYSSNYFDKLYGYAVELINQGLAYVDELSPDEIREYRGTLTQPGRNSPYRDRSVEENLALFEKMKNGEFKEGTACLRAKIDMASSFICMRDPVIYRIKFQSHHQTGDRWCIYPMYDFTHCISDALEGITHSICTLEFQDNRRLYDWVLEHISLNSPTRPHQYEFSRLNLEYCLTSKRKLKYLVDEKIVDGWDDPRMPTISGMRRRGFTPASIREFCSRIGVTKQENVVQMSALENCVREDLNNVAPRAMAVLDPVKVVIENYPADQEEVQKAPNHPTDQQAGERDLHFTREIYIDRADFREEANKQYKRLVLGKYVRLRYSYIIRAERCDKDQDGNITCIYCTYVPDTVGQDLPDGKKVKGVIHWVSAKYAIDARVNMYECLFKVPNPGAAEDFMSIVNRDSLKVIEGAKVEPHLADASPSVTYQFEREGYFCADCRHHTRENPVFNLTVTLRDSFQA
ncbi:MAG: glutamine--tRNA ligase [Succinivibrionaceae bacterium]|nr:glutamine--tRNA ligase [Succinivibrionaceae bacterium]